MQCWDDVLQLGPLTLDPATRTALLDGSGDQRPCTLDLGRLEFDLLVLLVRAQGKPVPRGVLLDAVWGQSKDVMEHVVEETVSTLRRKLGDCRYLVKTVRRVGYAITLRRATEPGDPRSDPRRGAARGERAAR